MGSSCHDATVVVRCTERYLAIELRVARFREAGNVARGVEQADARAHVHIGSRIDLATAWVRVEIAHERLGTRRVCR